MRVVRTVLEQLRELAEPFVMSQPGISKHQVERFWPLAERLDEQILRAPGVLGPALDPPADADEQTRLLAFLGRKA